MFCRCDVSLVPILGQSHGIQTVRFEYQNGHIGHYGGGHDTQKQSVSARQFGNEECAGEWACITPLITPAMPANAKFFSGRLAELTLLMVPAVVNPATQPINRLGAKIPPVPPLPLVAAVAKS